MNRFVLQRLSTERRREASFLLRSGYHRGAYYLAGHAVECALEACIAKQSKKHDYPDKRIALKAFTHDLEVLVRVAGLEAELKRDLGANRSLQLNWAAVKDWTAARRYDLGITSAEARDLCFVCTSRKNGVPPGYEDDGSSRSQVRAPERGSTVGGGP